MEISRWMCTDGVIGALSVPAVSKHPIAASGTHSARDPSLPRRRMIWLQARSSDALYFTPELGHEVRNGHLSGTITEIASDVRLHWHETGNWPSLLNTSRVDNQLLSKIHSILNQDRSAARTSLRKHDRALPIGQICDWAWRTGCSTE
jgi:hypothetical protein